MADEPSENQPKTLTPGQRLAASQAAKSARKAAQRGQQAQMMEDKALAQAAVAKDWLQENLKPLGVFAGTVLTIAAVAIIWSAIAQKRSHTAGMALASALEAAEDSEAEGGAAAAYAELAKEHAGTRAGSWARLHQGRALYEEGNWDESRAAYEQALEGADDEIIRWMAVEGVAYAYEGQGSYDKANEQLDGLRAVSKDLAPIASYQQGRLLLAQGKTDEAKAAMQEAMGLLNEKDASPLPFTRTQIEARLALIDPSQPAAPAFDRSQIEELIRQQQAGQQPRLPGQPAVPGQRGLPGQPGLPAVP